MSADLINRIHAANLFRSVKYTARSLMDWTDETGFVRFDYTTAMRVAEINSVDTLRTHLHLLKKAQIVESYHLNGAVNISFSSTVVRGERASVRGERAETTPDDGEPCAVSAQDCAVSAQDCAVSAQDCAVSAQDCAVSGNADYIYPHAGAPAQVGWLVNNNNHDPIEPTNQPEQPLSPVDQASTYALLVSIRMKASRAKPISERLPFSLVRQYVARWWYGRISVGGKFDNEPGIVVRWLENPAEYPLEREYPLEMLRDICPAAITNDEAAQMAAAEAEIEETFAIDEAATDATPTISEDELAAIWQAAQPTLEKLASYKTHLKHCRLDRIEADAFVIVAPNGHAETIQQHFVTSLRRAIASATNASRLPVVRIEVQS